MLEIKIYTTNSCPYCVQAKRLLQQLEFAFTEINLERNPDLRHQLMIENGGWRTVPMIFIGTQFIGGYDNLVKLKNENQLTAMVNG